MRVTEKVPAEVIRCGRRITAQEIEDARETVRLCSGLSRRELAETICEHWGWVTPTGTLKLTACLNLLEEWDRQGLLRLPAKHNRPKTERVIGAEHTKRTAPPDESIVGKLEDIRPIELSIVEGLNRVKLWNEYLDRYHYLGYRKPFGCTLRYFITSERGLLGCVLVAGAARSLKVRDQWLGWSKQRHRENLPWVINNSRFLIFPWVEISNLASHVLGQLARRVQKDWLGRWGYEPLLLETFVDPAEYSGTSYRAAGWIELGRTTGRGLRRKGCAYTTTPKLIYVKPLSKDFREQLCSETLQGRVEQ